MRSTPPWQCPYIRTVVSFRCLSLTLDPLDRRLPRRVMTGQERLPRQFHFDVGYDPVGFEGFTTLGNIVSDSVLETIAVREPFENGRQRRPGCTRAEDACPAQVFHSAREDLGRRCGSLIH